MEGKGRGGHGVGWVMGGSGGWGVGIVCGMSDVWGCALGCLFLPTVTTTRWSVPYKNSGASLGIAPHPSSRRSPPVQDPSRPAHPPPVAKETPAPLHQRPPPTPPQTLRTCHSTTAAAAVWPLPPLHVVEPLEVIKHAALLRLARPPPRGRRSDARAQRAHL